MSKHKINEGQIIAKARDKFFRDNSNLLEGRTDGQYLRNRLERAFIAGWDAAKCSISATKAG
jgi:hypothetical protein